MSYKQKIVSAVAAGFAVVSFSMLASAQNNQTNQPQNSAQKQERREHRGFGKHDGEGRSKHHGDRTGMRELQQLNLTDAQKQQIRGIMEANHKANPQEFQEFRQLVQAKRDGTITPEQTEKLKTLKKQMRQNSKQTEQQILAILTPEQRTQLEQIKEQRRQKIQEHRQMRQNGQQTDTQKDN